jgi:hypothetical protein
MTGLNGALKASLWLSNVSKKAEGFEEVGLTGSIRTDQESSLLKRNVCLQKIPPVLKLQASESHIVGPLFATAWQVVPYSAGTVYHRIPEWPKPCANP